jgi:hypothetical protein
MTNLTCMVGVFYITLISWRWRQRDFTEMLLMFSQTTRRHTLENGKLFISRLEKHCLFMYSTYELHVFNARDYCSLAV